MNLPNKLTIIRIVLTPVFLFLFTASFVPHHYLLALIVFAVASLTDFADGKIARKQNLITNFGKIADPIADAAEAKALYNVDFVDMSEISDCDAVILAVAHDAFANLKQADFDKMFASTDKGKRVLLDIKGLLDRKEYEEAGYNYWRL